MFYKSRGITLIELMVVIAVLGIIVSIAYPAYQDQMRKARRSDCHTQLMELASLEERFFTEFGRYTATITAGGLALPNNVSDEGFYTAAAVVGGGGQTFTLTCTGQGAQAGDGCGNLTIDNTGLEGRTGTLPLIQCW